MTDGPDAHEILPGLWLGNRIAALNDRWLKQQPFSHFIKKQYRLPVDDNLKAEEIRNMTLWSHEAVYKVLAEYNKNQKVLVHCAAGMQRSATVVGMLLIAMKGMTWQQAINYIQGIRLIAFRDQANFKDSLIAFDTSYHREILPHISEPL